jgi:diguanylate cyclase (GGDEF)-like protein
MELDKSYLDSRTFDAFAETSKRQCIYVCNMQTNVSRWSKNAVEYFGLPGEYMFNAGDIWAEYVHPDDRKMYQKAVDDIFSGKKSEFYMEYRARNKDGDYVVCTGRGVALRGNDDCPDLFAGAIVNHGIVDSIDSTTGLYNVYEFLSSMRDYIENKTKVGVLMVGFNRFSDVNDVYSYVFGNKILRAFANELKELVNGRGRAFRMNGAKFALIVADMTERGAAELYAAVQEVARSRLSVGGINVSLSISGGATIIEDCSVSEYTVQACLTYALERSKQDKHSELVFLDNEIQGGDRKKLELMNVIRQSVLKGCKGFYLCYQPLVKEGDHSIIGMEALLRWKNDTYGEVSPGAFIPWLENDACFFELGNWILKQALTDGKKIIEEYPDFIINVNVSYSQLERSGFRTAVFDILEETGFPAKNLCIELTERCRNLNMDYLKTEVAFFRSKSIRIALDDFGTGASSLCLLREMPIDCLKIDQTFISNIQSNSIDQTIVETVISCANKLGIAICIEGVENRQINDFVEQYKADTHQGYYYSRPVSIEKFTELLKSIDSCSTEVVDQDK